MSRTLLVGLTAYALITVSLTILFGAWALFGCGVALLIATVFIDLEEV